MNAVLVAFAAFLAVASAGLLPYASHAVLQGPGSHAAVIGPDGSSISSVEHGGAVVLDAAPAVVAHAAPVVAAYAAPAVHAYAAPVVHAAPVAVAHAAPVVAQAISAEGQYVPSGLENLYDSGSYRASLHLAGEHLTGVAHVAHVAHPLAHY